MTVRPRRSMLYMPGSNARAMEKARELPADGLVFDLEDSVPPDAKVAARTQIAAAIARGGYGRREKILRVNGSATQWHRDDLAFGATLPVDAVLLPKVNSDEDARAASDALDAAGAPGHLAIWCMIETPLGVLAAAPIAGASPRLAALVAGTEDLAKDLRARPRPDRLPFLAALEICVLAARAHGLVPLDAVYPDFADGEGFAAQCRQGRDLGFAGKTLIHPSQIAPANAAFGPSADELAQARRIVAAFEAAAQGDRAVAALDGKMIEKLHVDEARRLLALADAIASLHAP